MPAAAVTCGTLITVSSGQIEPAGDNILLNGFNGSIWLKTETPAGFQSRTVVAKIFLSTVRSHSCRTSEIVGRKHS